MAKKDYNWQEILAKGALYSLPSEDQDYIKQELQKEVDSMKAKGTLTQDNIDNYYSIFKEYPTGIEGMGFNTGNTEGQYTLDSLGLQNVLDDFYKKQQDIQKQQFEREDSAYQRAVADATKAGINPNLTGIEPAQSTTTMDTAMNTGITSTIDTIMQQIQKEFESAENDKDRTVQLAGSILIGLIGIFAKALY